MKKQELLKQESEAFLKYRLNAIKGNKMFAHYWLKKNQKIANIIKIKEAKTKRAIRARGITKLNTIKI